MTFECIRCRRHVTQNVGGWLLLTEPRTRLHNGYGHCDYSLAFPDETVDEIRERLDVFFTEKAHVCDTSLGLCPNCILNIEPDV